MRRFFTLLILMVTVFTLVGCGSSSQPYEEPTPTPMPTPVKPTYTVARGDIKSEATLFGRVAPVISHEVFFKTDGVVGQTYVTVNSQVTAGQLLADLQSLPDLEAQWAAADAEAKFQETASADLIRKAEIAVEIAQLQLEKLQSEGASTYDIQIQQLQTELAQMALDEVKNSPTTHDAQNKVKQLEAQMEAAQLTSPVDGTVISAIDPGRAVKTTTTAFIIGDTSQLEVSAEAGEAILKQLAIGMPVTVTFESNGGQPISGQIRQLPAPYGTGEGSSVRISLDLSPTIGGYQLGDQAKVIITMANRKNVLWLPPDAIRTINGRNFVVFQGPNGQEHADVKLGVVTKDQVEILSGLSEGQVVVGP